jgi:hypothetical protein
MKRIKCFHAEPIQKAERSANSSALHSPPLRRLRLFHGMPSLLWHRIPYKSGMLTLEHPTAFTINNVIKIR